MKSTNSLPPKQQKLGQLEISSIRNLAFQPTHLHILLIILISFLLYFNSLFNDFFIIDDSDQIINNPLVHNIQNIPQIFTSSTYYRSEASQDFGLFYRPLMLTTFAINYHFFGPDPLFFHLFQIILHTANTIILYQLFKKFFHPSLSFFLSLVFLVHPINSEVILHAANTQENLFIFFGLLTFQLATKSQKNNVTKLQSYISLFFVYCLMLAALFSKETALLFIFFIFAYWVLLKQNIRRAILTLIPTTAALLTYLYVRLVLAQVTLSHPPISKIAHQPLSTRLLNLPLIATTYLKIFFFPHTLANGQYWAYLTPGITTFYLPLTILIISTLLIVLIYKQVSNHYHKTFQFFLFWFAMAFGLHLQILPLESTIAERWFHLAIIGLLGVIGTILNNIKTAKQSNNASPKLRYLAIAGFIIIASLSSRTFIRTFDWRTSRTILEHDLLLSPQNYIYSNTLASLYLDDRQFNQAEPLVGRSVRTYPHFGNLNNLAMIHSHHEDLELAEYFYRQSLQAGEYYTSDTNFANFLLYLKKDYPQALDFTNKSLQHYPQSPNLWLVYAQALYHTGNQQEAEAAALLAFQFQPYDFSFHVLQSIRDQQPINVEKFLKLD